MKPSVNTPRFLSRRAALVAAAATAATLGGCALVPATGISAVAGPATSGRPRVVVVALGDGWLLRVDADRTDRVLRRVALQGLGPSEELVGLAFRRTGGGLYGLTSAGRLLRIDPDDGRTVAVADRLPIYGRRYGFTVNPVTDRIRIVSDAGLNLRVDPATGRVESIDPMLAGDAPPSVVAVAVAAPAGDVRVPVQYAIDAAGALVRQGSDGRGPGALSADSGRTTTIGPLGTGPLDDARLDIDPRDGVALAALTVRGVTQLYAVDLATGQARPIGRLAERVPVRGLAIES